MRFRVVGSIFLLTFLLSGCVDSNSDYEKADKELESLKAKYKIESDKEEKRVNLVEYSEEIDTDADTKTEVDITVLDVTDIYEGSMRKTLRKMEEVGFIVKDNIIGIRSGVENSFGIQLKDYEYTNDKLIINLENATSNSSIDYISVKDTSEMILDIESDLKLDINIFLEGEELKNKKK